MAAQNRLRLNQSAPCDPHDNAAEGSNDRPVGRSQPRSVDLTPQNPELVAQQEKLGLSVVDPEANVCDVKQ